MLHSVFHATKVVIDVEIQEVLERRAETAVMASPKGSSCEICGWVLIYVIFIEIGSDF